MRILMAHPVAATATTADYATFKDEVRQLFEHPINLVRADFEFRSRKQRACESVGDFLTTLCTLYADCTPAMAGTPAGTVTAIEEHSIAMQLAIGRHNRSTQEKLLQETAVSLANFKRIMEADETAVGSSAALRSAQPFTTVAMTSSYHKPKTQQHRKQQQHHTSTDNSSSGKPCCGCGQGNHTYKTSSCPAFGKQCRGCGVLHHFFKMCKKTQQKVHFLTVGNVHCSQPPPRVTTALELKCNNTSVTTHVMVDTGADISTVQRRTVQSLAAIAHIKPTTTVVSNFDGSTIGQVCGVLEASVKHGSKQIKATLYVVTDDMPAVVGRDLIQALELSISGHNLQVTGGSQTVSKAQHNILTAISNTKRFLPAALTDEALGTVPDFQHKITVTQQYLAHAARCRSLPFGKREMVNNEIQAMVDAGI